MTPGSTGRSREVVLPEEAQDDDDGDTAEARAQIVKALKIPSATAKALPADTDGWCKAVADSQKFPEIEKLCKAQKKLALPTSKNKQIYIKALLNHLSSA